MAVKIIKGDLLNCGADIICHQTNFFGMMGGGVAAAIWNQLLDQQDRKEYCSLCREMRGGLLGSVQMLTHHGKPFVANLFSQMAEPDKFDSLTAEALPSAPPALRDFVVHSGRMEGTWRDFVGRLVA